MPGSINLPKKDLFIQRGLKGPCSDPRDISYILLVSPRGLPMQGAVQTHPGRGWCGGGQVEVRMEAAQTKLGFLAPAPCRAGSTGELCIPACRAVNAGAVHLSELDMNSCSQEGMFSHFLGSALSWQKKERQKCWCLEGVRAPSQAGLFPAGCRESTWGACGHG